MSGGPAERPGGFLARWSRLKRGAVEEADGAPAAPAEVAAVEVASVEVEAAAPGLADAAVEPADAFDPATLPAVETLTAEADLTEFLRPGVPATLRNAAMRRLWVLDPAIREFVGPADYAWDFNAVDGVPGFAPTLLGDVRALLAQAIGQSPADAGAARNDAPAVVDLPAAEAAAPALPAPAEAVLADAPAEAAPAVAARHGSATPA